MALRPPRHSIDAEMVYISQHDPAWDHERIRSERRDLPDGETHPYDEWQSGATRFDAKTLPAQYLREDEDPTKVYLRRLERNLSAVIRDQLDSPFMATRAAFDAFRHGVKRIDGLEFGPKDSIDWPGEDRRKTLSPGDLDVLERAGVHPQAMADIGLAVIRANWILSDAEKKPSGS